MLDAGKGYSDIPYDVLNGMDRAGRDALVAYARAGGKVTTDPVAFYRLQDLALDHPQAFLDADLNDHIDKLDGQDLARLTALQATLREKGPADPQFSLQRVNGQSTDMMLNLLGLPIRLTGAAKADSPAGNSDLDRQAAAFKRDIDQRAAAQEAATGRKITPEEYQKLLVEMVVEQGAMTLAMRPVTGNAPPGKDAAPSTDGGTVESDKAGQQEAPAAANAPDVTPTKDPKSAAIAGMTAGSAVMPSVASPNGTLPALSEWAAAAGTLLRGVAIAGLTTAGGALAGFVAGMWPTSTAGPELDMISPSQAMPPNMNDMRTPPPPPPVPNFSGPKDNQPAPAPDPRDFGPPQPLPPPVDLSDPRHNQPELPNTDEFNKPMESTISRQNKKKKAEAEARARGETLPKKGPVTPLTGLPPEEKREPKDQRGDAPFSKPSESLKPGDWIDLNKFSQKRSTKTPTYDDPETGYYVERDTGGHSDKVWKLRDRFGERIKSITRFGKVLSD